MCPGLSHPPRAADPELACVSSRHTLAVHAPVPQTKKKKQQKGQKESSQGCGGTVALCCFPLSVPETVPTPAGVCGGLLWETCSCLG